ncbi:MAG: hypothetical protein QXL94_06650 [Candidatus Parvarchaeum sp.]
MSINTKDASMKLNSDVDRFLSGVYNEEDAPGGNGSTLKKNVIIKIAIPTIRKKSNMSNRMPKEPWAFI